MVSSHDDTFSAVTEPTVPLFDVMYQCRAMRRLRPDPVDEELLVRLVDAALHGPSGSNAQNWAFVIVRDADQKRRVAEAYQRAWAFYRSTIAVADLRPHEGADRRERLERAGDHLAEHLAEAPAIVFVAVLADRVFDRALLSPRGLRQLVRHTGLRSSLRFLAGGQRGSALAAGSTAYPAVQNLLLAARALGLGAVMTTQHFFLPGVFERIVDLPRGATLAAVVPVGYPVGRFGPVSRPDPHTTISWDRWAAPTR